MEIPSSKAGQPPLMPCCGSPHRRQGGSMEGLGPLLDLWGLLSPFRPALPLSSFAGFSLTLIAVKSLCRAEASDSDVGCAWVGWSQRLILFLSCPQHLFPACRGLA